LHSAVLEHNVTKKTEQISSLLSTVEFA